MIGRTNRFHGRASIKRLYTRGKSVRAGNLALKYAPNGRQSFRLAVVVSRKVSKSAVVRNRIRRRLYENVRILSNEFNEAYDLVLLVYDASLAELPSAELASEVKRIIKKAKITSATSA
jgi:ribonuclease P protein component